MRDVFELYFVTTLYQRQRKTFVHSVHTKKVLDLGTLFFIELFQASDVVPRFEPFDPYIKK